MDKHGVSYHSYADDIQLYLKCGNNDISDKRDIYETISGCHKMLSNLMKIKPILLFSVQNKINSQQK